MKVYLGLLDNLPPYQTRIFGEIDRKLIDLSLAYASLLIESKEEESAYEVAAFYFPPTIGAFSERREAHRIFVGPQAKKRFIIQTKSASFHR
jgi:hypothetical protein